MSLSYSCARRCQPCWGSTTSHHLRKLTAFHLLTRLFAFPVKKHGEKNEFLLLFRSTVLHFLFKISNFLTCGWKTETSRIKVTVLSTKLTVWSEVKFKSVATNSKFNKKKIEYTLSCPNSIIDKKNLNVKWTLFYSVKNCVVSVSFGAANSITLKSSSLHHFRNVWSAWQKSSSENSIAR